MEMSVRRELGDTRTEAKSVTILGSTGSIGCSTLDLIEREPAAFQIEALTGNRNVKRLVEQALRLKPKVAVIGDDRLYRDLKEALGGTAIEAAAGAEAVIEAADRPAEWVMAGIVGIAGLSATMMAAKRGATVALANKECLVCSGELLIGEVRRSGATLLPVDSEHNAIFQVFDFDHHEMVEKIILTASGGPFREMTRAEMTGVTPEQAVDHPNWDMGAKISVDSATMMNKGLELIEAFYLFPVPEDSIEILVHPQSVVHSMVAYVDGSVLAQMGTPDMRTPISFALGWPERMPAPAPRLDLAKIGKLTFEAPDFKRFPALKLAREALKAGGAAPTILNAANEIAVGRFLAGEIGFLDIAAVVETTLAETRNGTITGIDDVRAADDEARNTAADVIASRFRH
jgi:1-deoxy-D-xylulose-5-phosphate reductoisomerase